MAEALYHCLVTGQIAILSDFEDGFREVLNDPEADFIQSEFDEYVSEHLEIVVDKSKSLTSQ